MNKRALLKFAVSIAVGLAAATSATAADTPSTLAGVKTVSVDEAKKLHEAGVPFFDTRITAEYVEKTIKGAKSVPYKEKSA
jgi:hypothetical protein